MTQCSHMVRYADHCLNRAKINTETARVAWQLLLRFLVGGYAIVVKPESGQVGQAFGVCDNNS